MSFDWWTLALEAVNFLVLVALLRWLLYRPVLAAIDARQEDIDGKSRAIGEERAAAETYRDEYRAKLDAFDDERLARLEEDRGTIDTERREVLERARADADELGQAVRAELGREREDAFAAVREHAVELAVDIASRLLREAQFVGASEPFLERAAEHLMAMPAEERSRLLGVEVPASVRVLTAPPLTAADRQRWAERLSDVLGDVTLSFEPADELVCGCKLVFASGLLSFAWGPVLEKARAELGLHVNAA